jgi:hypothetical protein
VTDTQITEIPDESFIGFEFKGADASAVSEFFVELGYGVRRTEAGTYVVLADRGRGGILGLCGDLASLGDRPLELFCRMLPRMH